MIHKAEELFCVTCGSDVQDKNDLEWHKDVGHKIVPKKDVEFDDDKKKTKSKKNKKQTKSSKQKTTDSKILYDHAQTKILKTVVSQNNSEEVYAIVRINNHIETINLSSTRAKHWLNNEYTKFADSNELHSDDFYKTILNTII